MTCYPGKSVSTLGAGEASSPRDQLLTHGSWGDNLTATDPRIPWVGSVCRGLGRTLANSLRGGS